MLHKDRQPRRNDAQGEVPATPASSYANEDSTFMAELATGLWRIKRKLQLHCESGGLDELRGVCHHVESTLDLLRNRDVEIRDDTGAQYVAGMALKVIAFQPTEGAVQETICETIRPSVYYKGRLIQRGEIVVATPKNHEIPSQNESRQTYPETETVDKQPGEWATGGDDIHEKSDTNNIRERNQ